MPALNSFAKNGLFTLGLIVSSALLAACGYRGPLYLPEEAPPTQQPEAADIPQEESADEADDKDDA